ncbi:MAG: hypothetical protein FH756_04670 [Firmicutes bacterium]|nr:hypothetical protein [Bacillota bacterium]
MVLRLRQNRFRKNIREKVIKNNVVKNKVVSEPQDLKNILNNKNASIESVRVRYDYEQAAELAPAVKSISRATTTKNIAEKVAYDTFTTGTVAGVLGTVALHALSLLWSYLGFIDITTMQVSGEIFLNQNQVNTFAGFMVSIFAHFVIGAAGGVLLAYFMKLSGHDFYWLKGVALAGFMLLTGMGLVVDIMRLAPQMRMDAAGVLFHILSYFVYGLIVSYVLYKFAKIRKVHG